MIPKATQDKISKYRQKIKQNIIYQQNAGQTNITPRQPITPRQYEYQKPTSTLSRSNIRKNPIDSQPAKNYIEEDELSFAQQNSHRNKIFQPNPHEQAKPEYHIKVSEPKHVDQRTAQKLSTSKSPTNRNPYLQEREAITKRKTITMQNPSQGGNRGFYPNTSNFHNLSSFETFNQKPMMVNPPSSVLPPLFPPLSPSNPSSQQVKVLLEENQILSLHLNEKMQRIRTLQKELKAIVKNEILHEQKFDIEVSQLAAENEMIKKSTDQQVKTLVMQVKKLNDELIEKQQEWQERLNKIRKINLDEQQQTKKNYMLMEQKYKSRLQQMRIQIQKINEEFKASKQSANVTIENLKAENTALNQSIEKFTHIHKMEKSELTLNHENLLRQTKEEHFKKLEIINLDRIRKQNQLQNNIEYLNKEISKLQDQISLLKHEKQFSQVKVSQQKGKMMIELREEKQKIQQLKHQQNSKLQKISQTELQTITDSYESQISELSNTIVNLQTLLETRAKQIENLYKQISDTRSNYQQQLSKKQAHVQNMKQKMQDMSNKHIEEQQCFKIKMAELTQANQLSLKELYEKHITEIKHLNLDKDKIIKSLRQKISNQFLEMEENNLLHYQEIKEMQTKIQQLQQHLSINALKERNMNVSTDKQSIILKENLLRQSQAYEKATNVKEENIKRLQKIIETKDKEIEELQEKLQLLKKSHKDQLSLQKDQYETTIRERDDAIVGLKIELQYSRKEQTKKAQQFSHDKEYYSNQMKQLKNKSEKDFNEWLENLSSEINALKTQNQDLKYQLQHLQEEYQEYKKLWNEEETLIKMAQQEKQFIENLNATFTSKYQKLIDSYEKDIESNYKPKIKNLNEFILEKQQQINDMKTNYHQLQVKFQKLMQDKETQNSLNQQIFTLGKSNSALANNFVTLGK